MKNIRFQLLWIILLLIVAGCSSNGGQESSEGDSADQATSEEATTELDDTNGLSEAPVEDQEAGDGNSETSIIDDSGDRMLIYNAHIELETEDYEVFRQQLDKRMEVNEAYVVEANISKGDGDRRSGQIRLRVPQQHFESMIGGFEEISDTIISQNITGRDVTEDYVDLESRLTAKEKIETRLLTFLDQAEETDSLLKISQDLERIQSEIEVLKGKMNYLQNQSDFSTITLGITETKVVVPDVGGSSHDTWERTKQAFASSINGLTTFVSWLVVTVVGYSPFLIPILLITGWFWYRKKKSDKET
ncbi:DUF4349 domain-containing protein [Halobacillus salinus]|uniref:DUF4349 domain-containing protein n=1 Tax=Halobacillus salinus TaxID=192814 RepID=A0A4Z0H4A1_9BACI|nr:DUF4349 domain-containing protein [Halobacillus salinus]TGB05248.1 DUF4349 domain-containing protein [Halobacillus salinus]